jgi:mediator of RNA polymerase II transcription subunit 8
MDPENLRTIEQLRQRFQTLSLSLQRLIQQLNTSSPGQPLPSWNTLLVTQKALASQLQAFQQILSNDKRSEFLLEAHAFPTAAFPFGEENALGVLLRKRLEPDVVAWTKQARELGAKVEQSGISGDGDGQEWEELWKWAGKKTDRIRGRIIGRPKKFNELGDEVEEDLSEDSDDEDEEMEDEEEEEDEGDAIEVDGEESTKEVKAEEKKVEEKKAPMRLEDVMKFATIGAIPLRRN